MTTAQWINDLTDIYNATSLETSTVYFNGISTVTFNGSAKCEDISWRWSKAGQVILCLIMVMMITVSMLGNSIVCLIVYQKPEMRSAINLLLANMACSDILLAIASMPFAFVSLVTQQWVFNKGICQLVAFFHSLFICEAVCILLTISLDRYLIIVYHKDKLTPHRAKVFIILSWCFSVLVSFPPTLGWGYYEYYAGWPQCILRESTTQTDLSYFLFSMTVKFFLPMLIMAYSFLQILNTVRRNRTRIHVQNNSDILTINQISKLGLTTINHVSVDMSFKTRAFKTILLLYLLYLICWAPFSISVTYWNLTKSLLDNYIGGSIAMLLGYMNSCLNPVIYCVRIKKFREACQEIIPKSLQLLPDLPERTKRRIHPGAAYEYTNDHQTPV